MCTAPTMPETLVLSGVRSPRTYASSVTCSTFPPSQEFQFRVTVIKTARASSTTSKGVTYLCQRDAGCAAGFWSLLGISGFAAGGDSTETGAAAINHAPRFARNMARVEFLVVHPKVTTTPTHIPFCT